MPDTPRWKLWYADGSVYSDLDGPAQDAPGWGLLFAVQRDQDHGYRVIAGGQQGIHVDYYWWDRETESWFVGDYIGREDYLALPGWRKVINGRSVLNSVFWARLKLASEDPDFPAKTGWLPDEPRL